MQAASLNSKILELALRPHCDQPCARHADSVDIAEHRGLEVRGGQQTAEDPVILRWISRGISLHAATPSALKLSAFRLRIVQRLLRWSIVGFYLRFSTSFVHSIPCRQNDRTSQVHCCTDLALNQRTGRHVRLQYLVQYAAANTSTAPPRTPTM